jgi:hypothetical protein
MAAMAVMGLVPVAAHAQQAVNLDQLMSQSGTPVEGQAQTKD